MAFTQKEITMIELIPAALKDEILPGEFIIPDDLKVKSDFELSLLNLERDDNGKLIIHKDDCSDKEGYRLEVDENSINIYAGEEIGAYYALQSLRQISRYELGSRTVPCCKISDKPRFKWRGLQLDESRHFFGKEEVKRLLDMMFMMKLNVFHWHLTDDQGWRIEIKKYPLLTEIASKRDFTHIGGWGSRKIKNEPYSGYYTQEDISEIVDYAAKRGIMIVPEIDFPAHCAAAIAAYPVLACREIKTEVPGYFGGIIPEKVFHIKDWNRTICAGKDKTMEFVFDVIDEVCSLFPAPYFHIGGDEAPKDEWKKCPCCQQKMKEQNLKNEEDLQGYFNNLIFSHLKEKGKRLIGWNEILAAGNLDKTVIAQYWTPKRDKNAERHVNTGGNMILSNHQAFYFDMPYGQYSLKNTYNYTPENFGVNKENVKNVMGVEGENWTEWTDGREKLDLMLYPRVQALAEVAWSPAEKREWNNFKKRLDNFKDYFNLMNINYAVDKVSMPAGVFNRLKINRLFRNGDTYFEVKLNKEYRSKGEK